MASTPPESPLSSGRSTPVLSALDSTSALILINDSDDEDESPAFDLSSDDGEDEEVAFGRAYVQPLPPSVVFVHLLSPYLKLGAILLPSTGLPLKFGLPPLLLFALLSVCARRIWYMLSRYFRKAELEDILLEAFAKGRNTRARHKGAVGGLVRTSTIGFRVLLAMVYLREQGHKLPPLLPNNTFHIPIAIPIALLILPLCTAPSLGSKRVLFATWSSIITYVLWFACVSYAHAKGTLKVNSSWLRIGTLWQGVTTTAFIFTSSSTLSLYASLKAGMPSTANIKASTSRSFNIISLLAVSIALALSLPLVFFAASPNIPQATDEEDTPVTRLGPFIAGLEAATLTLGIPSILSTIPPLPKPGWMRISTSLPVSKLLFWLVVLILSLIPSAALFTVLSDILLVCALFSTYLLPAIVHIAAHFFRRPLSIIVPSSLNSLPPSQANASSITDVDDPLPSAQDELLQRKERAMQRRQLRRRVIWDISVWILLFPVGGGGIVWAVSRIVAGS